MEADLHQRAINYMKKLWKKSKSSKKLAYVLVRPDPQLALSNPTRPDPSPQKSGSKPSLISNIVLASFPTFLTLFHVHYSIFQFFLIGE